MREDLFQKTGLIISKLAYEMLEMRVGERISSISVYQDKFGASRGTIQNALQFLKNQGAIVLLNRGQLGTYIEQINYSILQQYSLRANIVGIMPLPYSKLYEGMATALYMSFEKSSMNFNLAYVRGSETRMDLVVSGAHDFAVCSKHAALQAIKNSYPIEIAIDFGVQSYLSEHVLIFKDLLTNQIKDGMRVGIDVYSFDQRDLTHVVVGNKQVEFVNIHSHQIIAAIKEGSIDVGVWTLDEILEKQYSDLNVVSIKESDINAFSEAVIIIRKDNIATYEILKKYIDISFVRDIQKEVKTGKLVPSY